MSISLLIGFSGLTSIIADAFAGAMYVLTSISIGLLESSESTVKILFAELRLITSFVEFKSEEKSKSMLSARREFFRASAIEALLLVLLPLMLILFMLLILLLLLKFPPLALLFLFLLLLLVLLFLLLLLLLLLLPFCCPVCSVDLLPVSFCV